jgi:site-specific DNA-cytosine methylase
MNVLSLFDGISCGRVALDRLGVKYENYYASEINKYALQISKRNYPDTIQLGDVNEICMEELPVIDLLIGGPPCQGFSRSGKLLNFNDKRSKLFFKYLEFLENVRPQYFLMENVRMPPKFSDVIDEMLGVKYLKINSSLVSAQNRSRFYWTDIPQKPIVDKDIQLRDIVGDFDNIKVYPRGANKGGFTKNKFKCPTITSSSWQNNFHLIQNGERRMFTVEECEILQTLPVGYTEGVSKTQRYTALGNAWTVDVIVELLKEAVYA